jgi:hypothetical protein
MITKKQAWTNGYRAQTKGAKVFDNPETGRNRCAWYDGFAASERETFVVAGVSESTSLLTYTSGSRI